MVLASSAKEHIQKRFTNLKKKQKEVYHRIDKRTNDKKHYCRVFSQLATKGRYTILTTYCMMVAFFIFHYRDWPFSFVEAAVIKIDSNAFWNSSHYYKEETTQRVQEIGRFLSYLSTDPDNKIFQVTFGLPESIVIFLFNISPGSLLLQNRSADTESNLIPCL